MVIAFVVAMGMNLFSLWNSDKMVLKMFGAQEVDERSAPEYYGLVRDLARRAELPMPRVFVMQNPQPNAFATGRSPSRCGRCRLHRPAGHAVARRSRRRHRARARAHQKSRHADDDHRRHHRRRHLDAGAVYSVRHDVRRSPRRPRRRHRDDRLAPGHARCAVCGHAGADGDQPLARVQRRPHGRAHLSATRAGSRPLWSRFRTPPGASRTRKPSRFAAGRTCSSSTR